MAKIESLTRLFEDAERDISESLQAIIVRAYEEGCKRGRHEGFQEGFRSAVVQLRKQFEHIEPAPQPGVIQPASTTHRHTATSPKVAEAVGRSSGRATVIGVGMAVESDEALALKPVTFVNQQTFFSPTVTQSNITEELAKQATGRTRYGAVDGLVQRVLREAYPGGLNGKEIAQRIHALGYLTVKQASVRGKLAKMKAEGRVEKDGKLWRVSEEQAGV